MPARRNYTDSEMMRMQQDAINRVREMQSRARYASENASRSQTDSESSADTGFSLPPVAPDNQGWSTNPNFQRPSQRPGRSSSHRREVPSPPPPPPPPEVELEPPAPMPPPPPEPEPEVPQQPTTIIEDILKAVGLDDDRVLILGLLFILINAKADTTLILALIYLLI